MAKNKHTEINALQFLDRKVDCKIKGRNIIIVKNRINDLGNGSWGVIDFLINYRRYILVYEH